MSRASSQLRVFVSFKEDTVFAGEDVECTIAFKNVEVPKKRERRPLPAPREDIPTPRPNHPLNRLRNGHNPSQASISRKAATSTPPQSPNLQRLPTRHRNTSSFSVVESAPPTPGTPELPSGGFHVANVPSERKHGRRISIVSLGPSTSQQRPAMKHSRSASVQASANNKPGHLRRPSLASARSQSIAHTTQPSFPRSPSLLSTASSNTPPQRASHSSSPVSYNGPSQTTHGSRPLRKASSDTIGSVNSNGFQFPPAPARGSALPQIDTSATTQQPVKMSTPIRSRSPRSVLSEKLNGRAPHDDEHGRPLSKVFSLRSMDGTPRSSVDLYNMSNDSNETLTSEIPALANARLLPELQIGRRTSLAQRPAVTETILMGFAQISGSFMLDGSLVNQAPFEETKRKAVVGGQGGGGVVGVTRPAAENGLFGGFTWNSIGESLGEMIGAGAPSSMKEMKKLAGSNSVPLISTSKSILFVDLNLAPGQSRSYIYKFPLPRGLPPSHKGRAIKVSYNVVVGTHRPGTRKDEPQRIKQVEVPFRVLSGINPQGEALGHDLMSPYIILKDQARTESLATDPANQQSNSNGSKRTKPGGMSSAEDFQSYVNHLLTKPRRDSTMGLLSPTAEPTTPRTPISPSKPRFRAEAAAPSVDTLIDHAIRYCTNPSSAIYSPTNFTIARASIPIASLKLSRPALKMGETLTCVVDFANAKLPCYAMEASLESSERVDPALAIRSPQSVERATRRVWASSVENAIWARRCVFRAQIPISATPAFTTTGVSLEWCVRLELVVGLPQSNASGGDDEPLANSVLEVAHADDRGTVLAAKQHLPCDSFQVEIPIRVFGAKVGNADDGPDLEGLPV